MADGNFHDIELSIYRPRVRVGFDEVWINCGQYWYVDAQAVEGEVWFKDKPTGIWLEVS